MTDKKKPKGAKRGRLGKLPPAYQFFLNPHQDYRFTKCPLCEAKMRSRKLPFLVHVDPMHLLILNMTAAYCPGNDLLIVHKDILESLLAAAFATRAPEVHRQRLSGSRDDQAPHANKLAAARRADDGCVVRFPA